MNPDQKFVSAEIKTPANATAYYEFERVKAPATMMPMRTAPASLTHLTGSAPIGPPDAEPLALFTGTPIQPVVKSLDVNPDTDSKNAPRSLKTEGGRDKRDAGQVMMFYPVKKRDMGVRVREERLPDNLTGVASHNTADPPTTASMFDPVFTGEDTKSNMRMIVSSLGSNGFVNTAVHSRIILHVTDLLMGGTGIPIGESQGLATSIVNELVICHTKPHTGRLSTKQGAFLQMVNPLSKLIKQTFIESDLFHGNQQNLTLLKITLLSSCYGAVSEEDHMQKAFTEYINVAQLMLENSLSFGIGVNEVLTLKTDIQEGNVVSVFEPAYALLESIGITSSMTHFFAGVQWMHMLATGMSPQDVAIYTMGTARILREMRHLQSVPAHVIDLATLSECALVSVDTFRKGVALITKRPGVPYFNEDLIVQISHLWSDMSRSEFRALLQADIPPERGFPGLIAMGSQMIQKYKPSGVPANYTPLALGLYQQLQQPIQVNTSVAGSYGTLLKSNERLVLTSLVLVAAGVRLFQISFGIRSAAQRALQTLDYALDIVGRMKQLLHVIREFNSTADDISDKVLMEGELVWRPTSETMFFHKESGLFKDEQFEPTQEELKDAIATQAVKDQERDEDDEQFRPGGGGGGGDNNEGNEGRRVGRNGGGNKGPNNGGGGSGGGVSSTASQTEGGSSTPLQPGTSTSLTGSYASTQPYGGPHGAYTWHSGEKESPASSGSPSVKVSSRMAAGGGPPSPNPSLHPSSDSGQSPDKSQLAKLGVNYRTPQRARTRTQRVQDFIASVTPVRNPNEAPSRESSLSGSTTEVQSVVEGYGPVDLPFPTLAEEAAAMAAEGAAESKSGGSPPVPVSDYAKRKLSPPRDPRRTRRRLNFTNMKGEEMPKEASIATTMGVMETSFLDTLNAAERVSARAAAGGGPPSPPLGRGSSGVEESEVGDSGPYNLEDESFWETSGSGPFSPETLRWAKKGFIQILAKYKYTISSHVNIEQRERAFAAGVSGEEWEKRSRKWVSSLMRSISSGDFKTLKEAILDLSDALEDAGVDHVMNDILDFLSDPKNLAENYDPMSFDGKYSPKTLPEMIAIKEKKRRQRLKQIWERIDKESKKKVRTAAKVSMRRDRDRERAAAGFKGKVQTPSGEVSTVNTPPSFTPASQASTVKNPPKNTDPRYMR